MGSLASGIFGLVEGDPTEKEEHQLGGLGSYETGTGEGLTTAGAAEEEDILSGDPTKTAQALAPELSSGQTQVEQQAKQNAEFGNRGGGTNASTQAAESGERGNIINLVGGLQSGTAGAAVGQGSGLLGQASSNINSEAGLARAQQQAEQADVGGIVQGAAQIASGFMGGGGGGGETPEDLFNMGNAGGSVATEDPGSTDLIQDESTPQYQF
jgi:hypothetical protein